MSWTKMLSLLPRRRTMAPAIDPLLVLSGEMLCLHDADSVILRAAGAVGDIAGVPADDVVGSRLDDFVHPDDRSDFPALWTRLSAGEVAPVREFRLVHPTGRTIWGEARFSTVRGDGGNIWFGSAIRDVTRRHLAESGVDLRLRQAQEEIAAVASVGPGILYRTILRSQDDQRVVFVSQNAEKIVGISADALTRPGWIKDNLPPDLRAAQWRNVRRAIERGTSSAEYHYRTPGGRSIWARDTVRHVHGHDQQHEMVGYWIDITEEKERTLKLAQAAKLATLGEMAAGMAHELSQPLASISIAAETAQLMLQASPADLQHALEKVERIAQQTVRAAKLIDHLRIFGRRPTADRQPVDLAGALDGALLIADGRLRKAKVKIMRTIEPNVPKVMGSSVLVEQVMINLIANACDAYTDAAAPANGKRSIDISVGAKDGSVVLVVADHAGGIKASDLSKVFQPFFTSKAPGEGTGLGLSISYGIIAEMGGTMAASNSDDGAVFEIRLPIPSRDEDQDADAAEEVPGTGA